MAKYHYPILLLSLLVGSGAYASNCSTVPNDSERDMLCYAEKDNPIAKRLCLESVKVTRDEYGRIAEFSYTKDERIPDSEADKELRDRICNDLESTDAKRDCSKSFQVNIGFDGKLYGFSFSKDGKREEVNNPEMVPPDDADGTFVCKSELLVTDDNVIETLSYQKCLDNLDMKEDGSFVKRYTMTSVSPFPTSEEAKTVCNMFEFQSSEYSFCKERLKLVRDKDGEVLFPSFDYTTLKDSDGKPITSIEDMKNLDVPADFVPAAPGCAQQKRDVASVEPSKKYTPSAAPEDNSSSNYTGLQGKRKSAPCEGLKGSAYKSCMDKRLGEVTVVGFDGCKAIWDSQKDQGKSAADDVNQAGRENRPKGERPGAHKE